MTLRLDQRTDPEGVEIKASGGRLFLRVPPPGRHVGLSMEDFAELVVYTLVNTDLTRNDPRLALMERLRRIRVVEGYNGPGTRRLEVIGRPGDDPGGVVPLPS